MSIDRDLSKKNYQIWRRKVPNKTLETFAVFQMKFHKAELIDNLELLVGETVKLESLKQPVIPPHFMLMPFIETPKEITVEGKYTLEEDGFHGCVYQLRPEKSCKGDIIIGFRDIQSGETTHRKVIPVVVY